LPLYGSDTAWIFLLLFFISRTVIPLFTKSGIKHMMESPSTEKEKEEYKDARTHSITLASFVIVAISVILAWPANTLTTPQQGVAIDSVFYLSIGMISFFIGSYLFTIRVTRWFVFAAESLEYTGIIATGLGFLELFHLKVDDYRVNALYSLFVFAIGLLAYLDVHFNRRFFFQKDMSQKDHNDHRRLYKEGSYEKCPKCKQIMKNGVCLNCPS
jgi:hypothetical protein